MENLPTASLQRNPNQIVDPNVRQVIGVLATKAMLCAKYFCPSMLDIAKYGHYTLNTPLYAHFASPIRRYAGTVDCCQLESALVSGSKGERNPHSLALQPASQNLADRRSITKVAQQYNAFVASR